MLAKTDCTVLLCVICLVCVFGIIALPVGWMLAKVR